MNFRPRRSRLSREQWTVYRERFQLDSDAVQPTTEHTSSLKEPMNALLASLGLRTDSIQQQLMNQWSDIAGNPLCRHIRPGPLQNTSLTVYVTNSVMLTELRLRQGPALLKNIQSAVGADAVKKLFFQIDPDTRSMQAK
jgi:predicted nucleic acid-binding Zn ribbon protein